VFVCTHILTIWTQVFYLNQTMGQQWESDYYSGLGKTTVHSTSTTSIGTVNTPTNNINVEGTDNSIDITSELLNEAPVNSNTNQNPQRCLNLSNRLGESQC
jgi:hypothetical protein